MKKNYKLKTTNQFPKKLRQKVNTQNNWAILQIDLSGGERCYLRIDGDPPFIGGEEGGNPTSNRCGIPCLKKQQFPPIEAADASKRNLRAFYLIFGLYDLFHMFLN